MRIALLGKNGQLGSELHLRLSALGEVLAFDRRSTQCGDLSDAQALYRDLIALKPQCIVNAAAYTAVDQAESEPEMAMHINAKAPEAMANAARELGALLVHYSSDYVFDGQGDRPWVEEDDTSPLNVYGKTKREGELAILGSSCRHLIFRSSWIYGVRGGNFVKTMVRLAQEREQLQVIDDQWGAPTSASWLAELSTQAMVKAQSQPELLGLYHLVPSGQTNWHAYACHVIREAQALKPNLPWKVKETLAVPSSAYPSAARRPHNSKLDTHKFQKAFGLTLTDWKAGLKPVLQEIL
jgi:dTDP-4-dehydrorhamnose reductase